MKAMLLFPKWIDGYGIATHFAKRISIVPPLNLAYLAALAEKEGHEARIIDGQAEDMSIPKMIEQTIAFNPSIIGITATTPFYHIAIDLARGLKMANDKIPIAIGGHHISIVKEEAFSPCFDYAFVGEADRSWPIFLERHQNGDDISGVKGILFRDKGEMKFTGFPERIEDLDSIPFPARHLLKTDIYRMGTMHGRKHFTTIMLSRGCPYKCIFCSTAEVFGTRVRKRSVRAVVDEIMSVVSSFNVHHFLFSDDNLTIDRNYILEMCDLIEKEELKGVTFEGGTRANLVDEELISAMARAGWIRMTFGLETVNPEMRGIIKKEVPLETYATACRLTNKYGMETQLSVMLGLPGETRQTAKETLSYLRRARDVHEVQYSIAMPYPGTELYEMAKRGDHGLKLITKSFRKFRRYGSAVMSVGDLSTAELAKLQNDAFVSIYLAPWRIKPMMKRMGILGVLVTYSRVAISLWNALVYRIKIKGDNKKIENESLKNNAGRCAAH